MNTSGINGQTGSPGASAPTAADRSMGKDDFLRLFTAQLKAQNPLNPMDSAEFTAQLAQFSQLEQLANMNTQLTNMLLFQSSAQNMLTADLIGKQVKLADGEFHTVTGVRFDDTGTVLALDNGAVTQLGQITAIQGGS